MTTNQLTEAEKDRNLIRNKVANYFGIHNTKHISTEKLQQILNILEDGTN